MNHPLLAFHNDPAIKQEYLARVEAHRLADEIVQGQYWQNGKGCAVGCTLHSDQHADYETELGIPRSIAYLEDQIFEGLPNGDAKDFPAQFLSAIPVGADLSLVTAHFFVWLLSDPVDGVIRFAREDGKAAIETVVALYQRRIAGDEPTDQEWIAAADAADAADAAAYRSMRDQLLSLLQAAPVPVS